MRIRFGTGLVCLLACGGSVGCNSFDEPSKPEDTEPKLVIPIDERPVETSPVKPLAVSGGTLSIAGDGRFAVAADPERDRVSIVDLNSFQLFKTIELEPGTEPGRSVESSDGLVHVALRGSGEVVTIDTSTGTLRERSAVCKAPRGIAFDNATGQLHVACLEGKLVSLNAVGLGVVRTVNLDADLRDVVVHGSELWVTRFKSAEVLRVAATGTVSSRIVPATSHGMLRQPPPPSETDGQGNVTVFGSVVKDVVLQSEVAWRTAGTANGGAIMVHQQAVIDPVEVPEPSVSGGSAYGGGGDGGSPLDCSSGIVKNVVTTISPDGNETSTPFEGPPMAVDIALSPDQNYIAVAHASLPDLEAPRPFVVFRDEFGGGFGSNGGAPVGFTSAVSVLPVAAQGSGCMVSEGSMFDAPVTAVAFTPSGQLVVQMREPAQLGVVTELPFGQPLMIGLGGETRKDTGHELFHRDSGGGIACGSCHPEGTEDGHVWNFADVGLRRTQALNVGLRDTAPFHWAGDLRDVGALMTEVFVGRMGGVRQTPERLTALQEWLFSNEPQPPIRDSADDAVVRGQALFESAEVGCTSCHNGEKLTNNQTVTVTTVASSKLQVPSLVGVGYRAPFMHTGCASTLTARFDPACGGDAHGNTNGLSTEQIGDLVAYLESL